MKKKLGRVTELVDNIEVDLERMLKSKSIVLASQSNISDKNVKLNEVSMEDYFETQEQDIVNENIDTIYQHFQGFIAKHAEKFHSNILDVGCGIVKDFPRYFRLISGSYNYFGLDPIKINIKQRNYPLFQTFEQYGKVLETLAIPGTNSMFVCLGLNNYQGSA